MRILTLLTLITLLACSGCRWNGGQAAPIQPFGNGYPAQSVYQPGYEQTFPPMQGGPVAPAMGQFGRNAGQFVGNLASGFLRSAVGGAGFTAGRDLWNEIVR